jgi:hypothetical protein
MSALLMSLVSEILEDAGVESSAGLGGGMIVVKEHISIL